MLSVTAVFLPILLAPLAFVFDRRGRRALNAFALSLGAVCAAAALALCLVPAADGPARPGAVGELFEPTGFGRWYAAVSAVCFFGALVFSRFYFAGHGKSLGRFYAFWFVTEGAVAGVFLAADLLVLFVFFEIMGLASWVWVIQEETPAARRAADTYLAVSVMGGMALLMGLFLLYAEAGSLAMPALDGLWAASARPGRVAAAGGCLLFGFGAKAGLFPLHVWLPKAHPAAPAPASAVLSGILTKTGVFGGILTACRILAGCVPFARTLLALGLVTMAAGALLALFSTDIKRTLACSSVSQIGFLMTGTAAAALGGGADAALGVLFHMVNHSLYKLLLFTLAGVVYRGTGSLTYARIRGYGTGRPFLRTVYLVGAAGLAGVPLLSGYAGKTLLHEGLTAAGAAAFGAAAEWWFLLCGGLTAAYLLRLYFVVFTGKPAAAAPRRAVDGGTAAVLILCAAAAVTLGVAPGAVGLRLLAPATDAFGTPAVAPELAFFSWECLRGAAISLAAGTAVYFGLVRTLIDRRSTDGRRVYRGVLPEWADLELAYRFVLLKAIPAVFETAARAVRTAAAAARKSLMTAVVWLVRKAADLSEVTAALRGLTAAAALGIRAMADLPDALTVAARRTVFRENREKTAPPVGTPLTWRLGRLAAALTGAGRNGRRSYTEICAEKRETLITGNRLVLRSFSFGLLAVCIGIAATLIYVFLRIRG